MDTILFLKQLHLFLSHVWMSNREWKKGENNECTTEEIVRPFDWENGKEKKKILTQRSYNYYLWH